MDASDITVQVLSIPNSIQKILDPAEAVMKAKQFNDYEAELIRKHPTRFAGFASLPLQDPQAAADELERTVTQLSFKGAMINGHTHGEYVDERKFWVVWERAEALGVPLYLHPTDPLADQIKIYEGHQELLGSTWTWGSRRQPRHCASCLVASSMPFLRPRSFWGTWEKCFPMR